VHVDGVCDAEENEGRYKAKDNPKHGQDNH
jgi:hypothetical protein